MKFLMFNLVVSGALVYLLIGGEYRPLVVENMIDRASDSIVTVVEDTVKMIESNTDAEGSAQIIDVLPVEPEVMSQRQKNAMSTPQQGKPAALKVESHASPSVIDREPAPLLSEWSPEQPLPWVDDLSVIQRRAEVLEIAPIGDEPDQTVAPTFMTSQERQKELHTLAEEMELLFATAIIR